ncbi:tRNA threonylcarbamoyladenosine dehydratase [Mariprofundus erugo]|uniref:tRNA threonylcarbamoyladenosine dehydratase n=1 Tax=Mariprofundus erugo TaxID=2528639 RepID=A0A5R9GKE8_9PROT|nr:ThiF family adenylyltransferase [Mariprofundus erugo]TLS67026.1 tRNA threonylcarbamoyladenosine dehydratase [Mariprofundus erugo]TLS77272.1 tRNA threonylcarbamoyladenosine dehydratase [Mariprofundus erugo]
MSHAQERTRILAGDNGLKHLASRHVLVVGLGGVGGAAAEAVGRAGIGEMTIVDHDKVGISNINRQLVSTHSAVGRDKATVMGERLLDINPELKLHAHVGFLDPANMEAFLLAGKFDYVIDCIDSVACKAVLVATCQRLAIPVASSLGAGGRLDVTKAEITTLDKTYNCGLAVNLRRKLRRAGASLDYPVVFSGEFPIKPLPQAPVSDNPDHLPRAVNGTISYMPNLFGFMLAGFVIKQLLDAVMEVQS